MKQQDKPIIYQVIPRLFGNMNDRCVKNGSLAENGSGKFSSFTHTALKSIKELGVTHIWYTGIIEHATKTDYSAYNIRRDHTAIVKGKAGSPYAIKDYYDVDPDLADDVPNRMAEFEALIERTHKAGLKVIIDFVPNHVSRQYHSDAKESFIVDLGQTDNTSKAFSPGNNFYYLPGQTLQFHFGAKQEDFEYSEFPAKVTGNDCFTANPGMNDWYETIKLNYGVDYANGKVSYFNPIPDTWNKMLEILMFWAGKGIDGFRCDMAEMVPVEFWHWAITHVTNCYPVCFIAEVYNPSLYRIFLSKGKFDYLYDKVGLYDTLKAVIRKETSACSITKCWQAVEGFQDKMLAFMENHDEQRIASNFFAGNARSGIPAMMVLAFMHVNPVMIYFGQELGEAGMDEEGFSGVDGRTSIFDYWSIKSVRNWVNNGRFDETGLTEKQCEIRNIYKKILRIARTEKAITSGLFYDLSYANTSNKCFNTGRQYAFMRKHDNEVLLVLANFDKSEQTVQVRIPEEAFAYLGINDNEAAGLTDLLSGETSISTLTHVCPFKVVIPAFSGKALKFTYESK